MQTTPVEYIPKGMLTIFELQLMACVLKTPLFGSIQYLSEHQRFCFCKSNRIFVGYLDPKNMFF